MKINKILKNYINKKKNIKAKNPHITPCKNLNAKNFFLLSFPMLSQTANV